MDLKEQRKLEKREMRKKQNFFESINVNNTNETYGEEDEKVSKNNLNTLIKHIRI